MKTFRYLASAAAFALSISLMGSGTVAAADSVPESLTAETETVEVEASPLSETPGYTYIDLSTTMYAKSGVNVRSLPSTDGTRLGSLSKNQLVTVTGQCIETGWYRILYNDAEAFVSNKYLDIAQDVITIGSPILSETEAEALLIAAAEQFGPGDYYISPETGLVFDMSWNFIGILKGSTLEGFVVDSGMNGSYTSNENGFRKDVAQEIWNFVNAERTANGIPALAWDEETYEFSCKRAQAIVTDFSHNGSGFYGENILMNWTTDANTLHMQWYNSQGHHDNYMLTGYTSGACAVYVCNGAVYAVENFK